ncbi:MAG TPA: cytochrome c biogenesis protein CcdA [Firmicutes bacterium]|jgi:cytochrome c-type biogenesis protein|nr:cytochrome c biogenesis protein CcdA [Bacillota bacterium]
METPGIFLSYLAGLLSFFSPCVLAMAPGYLAVLTGSLPDEEGKNQHQMVKAALVFITGFSLVFVLLGTAFSALSQLLTGLRVVFLKVGGVVLILLGLSQWDLFRFFPLQREWRLQIKEPFTGSMGWLLAGITFAFGWTPCVGPILGMILTLAGSSGRIGTGLLLLTVYSLGLATPFFFMALAYHRFYKWTKKILSYSRLITLLTGFLLIVVGILLFTDRFTLLSAYLNRILGGQSLENLLFTK